MALQPSDYFVVNRATVDYKYEYSALLADLNVDLNIDLDLNDGKIQFNAGEGLAEVGDNATANQETDTLKTFSVKTGSGITIDANGNVIIDPNFNLDGNVTAPNDGVLTVKDHAGATVGTFTANQPGNTDVTLPEGFSGSYNDLTDKPTIGDGTLTIKNSDGTTAGSFTANQTTGTDITFPAGFSGDYNDLNNLPTIPTVNDGKLTIKDEDDNVLGEFTANQEGDTEVVIPAGGIDCAGVVDCINSAPVDSMRFALALFVIELWFKDPNDQPNWPVDQEDHGFYMYADLCDPVTHEIIPFDQEGHGHSGLDGSIFRLPHGYYSNSYCVITACPPTQHLEDEEVVYGVHPPNLFLEDLKVFTDRYEKGTTTTEDLFTTGTKLDDWAVSENGEKIYFSLPKCDSFGDPPNNWEGQRCLEDDFEDGGNYFFRLEFKYNSDLQKLAIILNHGREEGRPPPGGSTQLVNVEMPNIQIKPMEDN